MDNELEALITQNLQASDENNSLLEALITQGEKNDVHPELEAIATVGLKTKKAIKSGYKSVIESIGTIKEAIENQEYPEVPEFPPIVFPDFPKSFQVENAAEINSGIIESLNKIEALLVESLKEEPEIDDGPDKEKKHSELIEAIKDIEFPGSADYTGYFVKLLEYLKKEKEYFPVKLTEDESVKIKLSEEDIKSLGKEMSVTVHPGGGGGGIDNPIFQKGVEEIVTAVGKVEVNIGDVEVNTDGLETLVAETNNKLDVVVGTSAQYKISDIDSGTTSYFGFLKADDSWYIMKLTDTEARYIKGDTGYTTSWTGRAGLTYDYYNNTF
jgi:hypothetical protein